MAESAFEYTTRVEDGRTVVEVAGDRGVVVVVRSESGERIYLPPEGFDEEDADSAYQSARAPTAYDSPYNPAVEPGESPYGPAREGPGTRGVAETADGMRVTHPEEATEVVVFRKGEGKEKTQVASS